MLNNKVGAHTPTPIDDAVEKFFLPPCPKEKLPPALRQSGERPILHLLRRDLEQLYRKEEFRTPDRLNDMHGPPFFSCIGILSGIDTLARFVTAEADRKGKKVGEGRKFQSFLKKIIGMHKYDARIIWALRNALSHSYIPRLDDPLYKTVRVIISDGTMQDHWLTRGYIRKGRQRQRVFTINLWELKELFLGHIIPRAREALKNPKSRMLRKRFVHRYETHGRIYVRNDV